MGDDEFTGPMVRLVGVVTVMLLVPSFSSVKLEPIIARVGVARSKFISLLLFLLVIGGAMLGEAFLPLARDVESVALTLLDTLRPALFLIGALV